MSRASAATTSSAVSVSTPRWLMDAGLALALEEDQLQGRVGDGEVGVAGPGLGGLDAEHAGVEVDGLVEVGDVEGELEAHGGCSLRGEGRDFTSTAIDSMTVDTIPTDREMSICPKDRAEVATLCCAPVTAGRLDEAAATRWRLFKALADPVRLRLVSIIAGAPAGEVCACDLPGLLDRSQPTISHHLTLLVRAGLIDREQRGKWAWFRLRARVRRHPGRARREVAADALAPSG